MWKKAATWLLPGLFRTGMVRRQVVRLLVLACSSSFPNLIWEGPDWHLMAVGYGFAHYTRRLGFKTLFLFGASNSCQTFSKTSKWRVLFASARWEPSTGESCRWFRQPELPRTNACKVNCLCNIYCGRRLLQKKHLESPGILNHKWNWYKFKDFAPWSAVKK